MRKKESFTTDDLIYRDLASQYELDNKLVELIVRSEFEFGTEVMEGCNPEDLSTFRHYRLPYFGLFYNYGKEKLEKQKKINEETNNISKE